MFRMTYGTQWAVTIAFSAITLMGCTTEQTQAPTVQETPPAMAETDHSGSAEWVGREAATFSLTGIDGKTVDVGEAMGDQPVVLVFYRGVW
jgi:hypothetical protein